MAYFENNGQQLGGRDPRAGASGMGEYFSTQGLGGNATGEYFAASNGMGHVAANSQNMAVRGIGNAPQQLSPALPHGDRPWHEGILGARRQDVLPYGAELTPFRDGILGPGLGQAEASPDLDLRSPAIIDDLKKMLNLLAMGYTFVQNGWGQPESDAYLAYIYDQSPGYEDKSELTLDVNGLVYPTARGAYIMTVGALREWERTDPEGGAQSWAQTYPALVSWFGAYEGEMTGGTIAPAAAAAPVTKASTLALLGLGGVAVGLGFAMFTKKKKPMRSNPRRRRRPARRRR